MAANGASKLQSNSNPSVVAIAGWLFGDSQNWAEAQTRLDNVKKIPVTYGTNVADRSNQDDVVVYCNMDRYQSTTRKDKAAYDPSTGMLISIRPINCGESVITNDYNFPRSRRIHCGGR